MEDVSESRNKVASVTCGLIAVSVAGLDMLYASALTQVDKVQPHQMATVFFVGILSVVMLFAAFGEVE